jgi:hypothetical protein
MALHFVFEAWINMIRELWAERKKERRSKHNISIFFPLAAITIIASDVRSVKRSSK